MSAGDRARGKVLAAWEPPAGAGEPVGVIASTFSFDPEFFEQELLSRFLCLETAPVDDRVYVSERDYHLGEVLATVLVDRRHARRTATLSWDILGVPVPYECCQHAKISVLAWSRAIRVIVGSANLTEAGYRTNLEVFTALDFSSHGPLPASLLSEVLDFLRLLVAEVPEPPLGVPGQAGGPTQRARQLLDQISKTAERLALPLEYGDASPRVHTVFMGRQGPSILEQLEVIWGRGTRPDTIEICSPYWAKPNAQRRDPIVDALATKLAPRGERAIRVQVPGERELGDTWLAYASEAIQGPHPARLTVQVCPVPEAQDGERRPLHAKLVRWHRDGGRQGDLLAIGSSNATGPGLGLPGSPRNFEANLCFVSNRSSRERAWFDACFPKSPEAAEVKMVAPLQGDVEAEGRVPAVPDCFAWALFEREGTAGTLHIGFSDARDQLDALRPWRLGVPGFDCSLTDEVFSKVEHMGVVRLVLDVVGKVAPSLVEVSWTAKGVLCSGYLPVNAATSASRCDPLLAEDLDLDAMLAMLGTTEPLYRRVIQVLRARRRGDAADVPPVELDPHRRVDTRGFLMQRMRRLSRALEGLRERLSLPIASESALEWRLTGPVSPGRVARLLSSASSDATDAAFLLAELVLCVGRARRKVTSEGIDPAMVAGRFRGALEEVAALIPLIPEDVPLAGYVRRALDEARR